MPFLLPIMRWRHYSPSRWRDLAWETLILLDLPLSRDYFLSLFLMAGLQPTVVERTANVSMLHAMVANGFGYGLMNVPSLNASAPDGKPLRHVPIKGRHRPLHLGRFTMRSERKPRVLSAFESLAARR